VWVYPGNRRLPSSSVAPPVRRTRAAMPHALRVDRRLVLARGPPGSVGTDSQRLRSSGSAVLDCMPGNACSTGIRDGRRPIHIGWPRAGFLYARAGPRPLAQATRTPCPVVPEQLEVADDGKPALHRQACQTALTAEVFESSDPSGTVPMERPRPRSSGRTVLYGNGARFRQNLKKGEWRNAVQGGKTRHVTR
jgi:hypothetical protein